MEGNYYYMMVTPDEYELPLIVTESLDEMEAKTGVKKRSIEQQLCRAKRRGYNCIWKKVPKEEYKNLEEEGK